MESDVSNHTPNSAHDDVSSPYYMESELKKNWSNSEKSVQSIVS